MCSPSTRALRNFERDCIILVHTLKSAKCVNIVDLKVACWNMYSTRYYRDMVLGSCLHMHMYIFSSIEEL